jgi:diaminopimelate epimerase
MSEIRIRKRTACNDYLIADVADSPARRRPARIRFLCDRHRGLGSDGILLADIGSGGIGVVGDDAQPNAPGSTGPAEAARSARSREPAREAGAPGRARGYALRIFNPDGTEVEKSGNGLRIFGAWLYRAGWSDWRVVRCAVDPRPCAHARGSPAAVRGVADPGCADARRSAARTSLSGPVPMRCSTTAGAPQGGSARINTVSLSNPHCVVFVSVLERADFSRVRPAVPLSRICRRTNVQFARVAGRAPSRRGSGSGRGRNAGLGRAPAPCALPPYAGWWHPARCRW